MKPLFLSLGSNIEPRSTYLTFAIIKIESLIGKVIQFSKLYETESWGNEKLNSFYNMAVLLYSDKDPESILSIVKSIEKKLGSDHKQKWEARKIDIDIIFYGAVNYKSSKLIIPHHLAHKRKFVLKPVADIDENFIHPVFKKTIKELLLHCEDDLRVKEKVFE